MNFATPVCSCYLCRSMCIECPCMGTPKEIQALIDAGYAGQLMICEGNDPVLDFVVVMPKSRSGSRYGEDCQCVFYRNFQCILHNQGLKPVEGRVAIHNQKTPRALYRQLARAWRGKKGRALVEQFRELSR